MLDCPIMLETDLYGVICCEHTGKVRTWNTEDSLFVQSLADLIAISFKNEKIRALLVRIRSQNHELVEKTNEIKTINEQLNALNEELATMNESLEATVRRRTEELETQNQQLTEYAFINSHLLRAPLARILGLANLISSEVTTYQDQRLMEGLIQSTHELDTIIRRISDVLYAGSDLTRSDVKEIISKNLRM
jgi:signal transduction histidine kinase